ncbi:hypothetical protein D9611_010300 [Ephemerocybe angulata]|uniref:Nephrocystin 3-like N-terminal domain-containing protein n=1 Tax=Ephemerocybe angulata TaxID=980116 RepID=A0A8H5F1J4_9AGAR|nr:hypothetical protein D9611_010300 [Tulosesus angulatus]
MLYDFFQRSLGSGRPRIPIGYMERMTFLFGECHCMNSSVSLQSYRAVSRCLDMWARVLDLLIEVSVASNTEETRDLGNLKAASELEECAKIVRNTICEYPTLHCEVAKYDDNFARAYRIDMKAVEHLKSFRATLKGKLSRLEGAPKRHLVLAVYSPYIPPLDVSQGTSELRQYIQHKVHLVCADDWSLAAVMVLFMEELRKYKTGGENDWIGQGWTFYKCIPLFRKEFSFKDGKGRIVTRAIGAPSMNTKVVELAANMPNDGTSKHSPLEVSVLSDRKTSVFFNPFAVGNVFKFSNLLVLKAKDGSLHTLDTLIQMAKLQASPELKICQVPAEVVSESGSYIDPALYVPELQDIHSLLERIVAEVQEAASDHYHWTCVPTPRLPEQYHFLESPASYPRRLLTTVPIPRPLAPAFSLPNHGPLRQTPLPSKLTSTPAAAPPPAPLAPPQTVLTPVSIDHHPPTLTPDLRTPESNDTTVSSAQTPSHTDGIAPIPPAATLSDPPPTPAIPSAPTPIEPISNDLTPLALAPLTSVSLGHHPPTLTPDLPAPGSNDTTVSSAQTPSRAAVTTPIPPAATPADPPPPPAIPTTPTPIEPIPPDPTPPASAPTLSTASSVALSGHPDDGSPCTTQGTSSQAPKPLGNIDLFNAATPNEPIPQASMAPPQASAPNLSAASSGALLSGQPDDGSTSTAAQRTFSQAPKPRGGISLFDAAQQFSTRDVTTTVVSGNYTYNVVNHNHNHGNIPLNDGAEASVEEIVIWLKGPKFRRIYEEALSQHSLGTGLWFIESVEFRQLVEGRDVIVWGTGMPCGGKTVISAFSFQRLKQIFNVQEFGVAIVGAYIRYMERPSLRDIFAGLLAQLAEDHPRACDYLRYVYFGKKREELSDMDLAESLEGAIRILSKVILIIDGLDEADDLVKDKLLQRLPHLGANVLITSRPLELYAHYIPDAMRISIEARGNDIDHFIEGKINSSSTLKAILDSKPNATKELQKRVRESSKGMFCVAELQMESVLNARSISAVRKAVNRYPKGVNVMYERTWERIKDQSAGDISIVHRVFIWMLHSARDLSVHELQDALAVSFEDKTYDAEHLIPVPVILSMCKGLVVVEERGRENSDEGGGGGQLDSYLRFVHDTTHEYLKRVQFPNFPSPQTYMAVTCAVYLREHQGELHAGDLDIDFDEESSSFLGYASEHWEKHAEASESEGSLDPSLRSFIFGSSLDD